MLAYASRKKEGGGSVQQPLVYLDANESVPNAPAGQNILVENGLIARPVINRQMGGASVQQPLAYLDPTLPVPSASAGSDLLKENGLIARPVIPRQMGGKRGGFLPSIMKGVVNSGVVIAPLAVMAAHRMMNGTRKRGGSLPTTGLRGGGKKENWAQNRNAARQELEKYGKPSGLNVNKFAALKRKNETAAEEWLVGYVLKKRKTEKKGKKATKTNKNKTNKVKTAILWQNLVSHAKENLSKYGKPSGANLRKYASLKKKGEKTNQFVANFKTRKQYVSPTKEKTGRNEYKKNRQEAQQYLTQFGKPTVANVSKFVSLKRRGQNVKGVEEAVKARVKPVPVKVATVKPTAKSPPPKNLELIRKNLALLYKKMKALESAKKK